MSDVRSTMLCARQALGLTQAKFGSLLGISGWRVNAYEQNRAPWPDALVRLAIEKLPKEVQRISFEVLACVLWLKRPAKKGGSK